MSTVSIMLYELHVEVMRFFDTLASITYFSVTTRKCKIIHLTDICGPHYFPMGQHDLEGREENAYSCRCILYPHILVGRI